MSFRAFKRLQKQRELEQQKAEQDNASDDDSQDLKPSTSKFNAFDLLETEEADEQQSDIEEAPLEAKPEPAPTPKTGGSKKKKQKKQKGKNGTVTKDVKPSGSATPKHEDLDDIDRALQELSTKNAGEGPDNLADRQSRIANDETENMLCALLAVDSKRLNAMNEMKRLFGNAAVESRHSNGGQQFPARRRERNRQALDLGRALTGRFSPASRGQDLSGTTLRKNVLMQGKDEWPRANSGGLGMEVVEKRPSGVTEYKLVHNAAYVDAQRQFDMCVQSMQAERMIEHLQFNPYHISTLLQVSEIAKHQGDHAVSGDLLERALFNIGRSVQSSFASCIKEGKARLDFNLKENRELWLAGWRYIINLGMKGTWKTAYEWAKLLLSLGDEDPYCVSLTIDQIAIKAREHEHFIQLCSHPTFKSRWELFPNIQCSLALAHFQKGNAKESRAQLRFAMSRYPWVFCRLVQELNVNSVPKSIWGAQAPDNAFRLLTELYINRAKDIWNTPEAISLLVEVAGNISAPEPAAKAPEISLNVARHIILSDIPAVTTHLPRTFTTRHISASDPLPPNGLPEEQSASSWFFDAVRNAIGLDNAEHLRGGFAPPGRDDSGSEGAEWPEGSEEGTVTYLLDEGWQELCQFLDVHGIDPGNWQIDRDRTPLASWVETLRRLDPEPQNFFMQFAATTSNPDIMLELLREELARQTEEG
ncbi:hypothetical protein D8B26_003468 [Coccidioides posadasii str. Silveira]|uniref:Uncharacterized protein n=3 Tax=Coccidioides posadasii TaxID=199306 RepID=E9D175_COCPS|nr:hypothetical protein CPC735_003610 [Coccidioides posadasii C735 delta SOWgp]EER26192.1 hypothetical protein CPC735_003610 [Coccidioides posadasii C735 delta SOWgp]EFW20079.1 conserved hypothetical protein [Coccidioides posadasii str. Silveira]KMM73353.1 transcription factor 25 [Coccidioides posadasii RMSCC 3488]QVM08792.1 hypothetical protein D8B26_003468 [Coccidioides posadasii str. Silveira]|eukprot:XP_003068337.1 hypothetical protein CPC735_003610 [Coccidioides posadasii C735 delta SOWgp]